MSDQKPNIEFGSSVEFLGTQLMTVFRTEEVSEGKFRTSLVAKQVDTDQPESIFLNDLANRLAGAVKAIFGDSASMDVPDITLPPALADIAQNYTVQIKQTLLKVDKVDGQEAEVEYAFWIEIAIDEKGIEELRKKPPFNILMLKNLYIKVWKMKKSAELQSMAPVNTTSELTDNSTTSESTEET